MNDKIRNNCCCGDGRVCPTHGIPDAYITGTHNESRDDITQLKHELAVVKDELKNALQRSRNSGDAYAALVIERDALKHTVCKLREALEPFANVFSGLDGIGGGTLVSVEMKIQNYKDAILAYNSPVNPTIKRSLLENLKEDFELIIRVDSNTSSENEEDGLPDVHSIAETAIEAIDAELTRTNS